MFVHDPWSTETYQQAGPWNTLAGDPPTKTDPVLARQLHGLALAIYQAQQDILAAQARKDTGYVQARLVDLGNLRTLFAQTAAQLQANDPELLTAMDRFIVSAGGWIDQAVGALPGAIAAIPNALIDALQKILTKLEGSAIQLTLPLLALGGILIFFLLQAEKSSTVRKATTAALL